MNLDRAISIAVRSHEGQTDKAGAPYILHPLRVMMRMETNNGMIAAVLHDVVEDTTVTIEDLRQAGFAPDVLETLDRLTHRAEEPYDSYIERVSAHPLARKIKIADLEDNMDIKRVLKIGERDTLRWKKYHRAWKLLKVMEAPNQASDATSGSAAEPSAHQG